MSLDCIKKELQNNIVKTSNPARFFKTGPGEYSEHDTFIGVPAPSLRKIAQQHKDLDASGLKMLLHSPINEERLLALIILVHQYPANPERAYRFYLDNIEYINNWNLVDASAHLIIGAYLFDKNRSILYKFSGADSLWVRRIAIVSTWYFIKQRELDDTFKLAVILMNDKEDLIHKSVGWMLREAGKKNVDKLTAFLDVHAQHMPRTMLRYAIERLSPLERKRYLAKK